MKQEDIILITRTVKVTLKMANNVLLDHNKSNCSYFLLSIEKIRDDQLVHLKNAITYIYNDSSLIFAIQPKTGLELKNNDPDLKEQFLEFDQPIVKGTIICFKIISRPSINSSINVLSTILNLYQLKDPLTGIINIDGKSFQFIAYND